MMKEDSGCRSCDAPLLWAMTAKGRRMPLDVGEVEVDTQNAQIVWGDAAGVRQCRPLQIAAREIALQRQWSLNRAVFEIMSDEGGTYSAHLSHFATCPAAKAQRRRGAHAQPRRS